MKRYLNIITTFLLVGLVYTELIPVSAHSISPLRQDIALASGQRTFSSVSFKNEDNQPIEVKLGAYAYNAKTEDIDEDSKKIFLKLDTDTIVVKPQSTIEIKYEIYPIANLEQGTYFNIVTITPVVESDDITLKNSIAQLVTLHLVTPEDEVKGITTTNYKVSLNIVDKGIPFFKPAVISYTIRNDSNYVIQPDGGITVSSSRSGYKPLSFTINPESKKLFPQESMDGEVHVKNFNITDLVFDRTVIGHFYNGLDSQPQDITVSLGSYKFELIFVVAFIIGALVLLKSLKDDNKKESK